MRAAAVCVQNAIRLHWTRLDITALKQRRAEEGAVVIIQSSWKRFTKTTRFALMNVSCVVIQSFFRRVLSRRMEALFKESSRERDRSAVVLQRRFRGFILRTKMHGCRKFATMSHWRGHHQYISGLDLRQHGGCGTLQAHFQRIPFESQSRRDVTAVILIQANIRAARARHLLCLSKAAAAMIQSAVRGSAVRSMLARKKKSSCKIQRVVRGALARQSFRRRLQRRLLYHESKQMKAVRKIQIIFRLYRALRIQNQYEQANKAACQIQRSLRGMHCEEDLRYHKSRKRSVEREARKEMQQLSLQVRSANRIQKKLRTWLRFRRNQQIFAKLLQAHVRGYAGRKQYQKLKGSIIAVQSIFRRRLQQKSYVPTHFLTIRAVVVIQNAGRGLIQRNLFVKFRAAAILLQSIVRMSVVRSRYWFLHETIDARMNFHKAARKIQLSFLLWKMEGAVLEMESSAVILHRCIRGQLVRSASRFALSHMNASMRTAPLSPIARTSSPTNAQTLATFSSWHRAVAYAREAAAIVIQAAARRMLIRSLQRDEVQVSLGFRTRISCQVDEGGAIMIQRLYRRWKARLHAELALQKVYSVHRNVSAAQFHRNDYGWENREQLDGVKTRLLHPFREKSLGDEMRPTTTERQLTGLATQNIQRLARQQLAAVELARLVLCQQQKRAISEPQRSIRQQPKALMNRTEFTQQGAVCLQAVVRRYLARKMVCSLRRHLVQENSAVRIQCMVKCWTRRRRFRAVMKAALGLQRIYRTGVSKELFVALQRRHQEAQHDQEGRMLKLHLDRLEAASQSIIDGSINIHCGLSLGPCLTRTAAKLGSEVAILINSQLSCFPEYVDEMKKFIPCNDCDQMDFRYSPVMDRNIPTRMDSTPIRSNKSIPEGVPPSAVRLEASKPVSATQTQDFRSLLQEGRTRINQTDLRLPTLRDVPIVKQAPSNKKTDEPRFASLPLTAKLQVDFKSITIPGQDSFSEGHYEEFPSPIKQSDEEWRWADEW